MDARRVTRDGKGDGSLTGGRRTQAGFMPGGHRGDGTEVRGRGVGESRERMTPLTHPGEFALDVATAPAQLVTDLVRKGIEGTVRAGDTLMETGANPRDPRTAGAAFDVAGAAMTGGLGIGIAGRQMPSNAVGIFGGRLAKTADHAALARAEEMASRGVPREQIWNDTGWFKGVDGKWRFEIDDSGVGQGWWNVGNLSGVMTHDALYDAYPRMKNIKVSRVRGVDALVNAGTWEEARGLQRFLGTPGYIEYNRGITDKTGRVSTLMHEGQHAIQSIEGFSPGSAVSNDYHRVAGEVEARAVQKRLDLTPEQRRSRPPWLDYDVPEAQQIVRTGGTVPQMSAPAQPNGIIDTVKKYRPGKTAAHSPPDGY